MFDKLKKYLKKNPFLINSRLEKVDKMIQEGLPEKFRKPLSFLINNSLDEETRKLVEKIEAIRDSIAREGDKKISIMYSPKPGSSGTEVKETLNPQPGKTVAFTMDQIARTGKDKYWGTFMHLLVESFKLKNVFELGSCAGISGCYLSTSKDIEQFITVEGSTQLAEIAERSIRQLSPNAIVINSLFEEAIDFNLSQLNLKLDCIYIDGHHEKIATIHYYEKLKPYLNPNAIVIFDDISWSYDMREAWNILSHRKDFSHSLDLGVIGVCVYRESENENNYWNLQPVIGRVKIGDPHGWKE